MNRHDGTRIVEYLDGTRVTTSLQSRCEPIVDQETGESVNKEIFYTAITVPFFIFLFLVLDNFFLTRTNAKESKLVAL